MARRDGDTDNGSVAVLDRPLTGEVDAMANANGVGTADNSAGTAPASAETTTPSKAPKRNLDNAPDEEVVGITIRVPNAFRKQMAKTAVEQKTSVPQMLAQMAAEAFDFKLPKPERAARTKKYNSPEERKDAQKLDQQRQRLIARKVLEGVENGIINVDMQQLIAEVEAELAAKATAEPTTATAAATTEGAAS